MTSKLKTYGGAVLAGTIAAMIASPAAAATIELTTLNWEPYYGKNLENGGPVAALAKAAAKVRGHTIKVTYQPWKRSLVMAKRGKRSFRPSRTVG